jgi:hypothetical protein
MSEVIETLRRDHLNLAKLLGMLVESPSGRFRKLSSRRAQNLAVGEKSSRENFSNRKSQFQIVYLMSR